MKITPQLGTPNFRCYIIRNSIGIPLHMSSYGIPMEEELPLKKINIQRKIK